MFRLLAQANVARYKYFFIKIIICEVFLYVFNKIIIIYIRNVFNDSYVIVAA